MDENAKFIELLKYFMGSVCADVDDYANGRLPLELPHLDKNDLMRLIGKAKSLFEVEPNLIDIKSPCSIVGDIHGHILDLFRILKTQGLPDKRKYVFLGDLVDRGEFSVETITLVYLLKVLWPSNVLIIRGNHEFNFLAYNGGFMGSVMEEYGDMGIYMAFMKSFSYIPLALRIDGVMLCVHGGIGPSIFSIKQIMQLQRPIDDFGNETLDSLLWSDPSEEVNQFVASTRGTGYFFGEEVLEEFLDLSDLKMLIRGHECVMSGCELKFNSKCMTVFSASNYCGNVCNMSSVVNVKSYMDYDIVRFKPIPYLYKNCDMLLNKGDTSCGKIRSASSCSSKLNIFPRLNEKSGSISGSSSVRTLPKLNPILKRPQVKFTNAITSRPLRKGSLL